jgi:hypothetical protein
MAHRRVVPTLIALLFLAYAAVPRTALAESPAPGRGAARIQVNATVPPRASITVLHQEMFLIVTTEDISRGYVDAPAASRVEIRENIPQGYLLVFEGSGVPDSPVERLSVRGLGSEFEIGPGGGFVPRPHARGPVSADLSYRFSLSRDARPGAYPWPLSVSVRPL